MKTRPTFSSKVLIIGSGIGGLSTAIILTKLGFDVTVLEKNRQAGGVLRSYTRKGIDCAVGVHYLGSLDKHQILRTFFDYLGVTKAIPVTRMGRNGVIDRYIFTSPTSRLPVFDLPPGMDAYEENLVRAFPEEQDKISGIMAPIRQAAKQLHDLDFLYTPDNNFSLLDQYDPFGAVLNDLGCSEELRNVLAIPSSWLGVPLDDCPAYYHNMALASYISSSWRLQRNGAHMADVFAGRLLELGGKIITSAKVSRIDVGSRVVKGVHLQSGEHIPASIVIGAVHPKNVLSMLSQEDVKPSYRKRISALQNTHGIFSVHVSVDGTVHREIPHNIFKIDTDQRGAVADLKYYQIRKSEKKGYNLLSILTSGMDELWTPWESTQSGRRGKEYQELKTRMATKLVEEAAQMFGAFTGAEILDASTPLTLRDWVNSPDGSAYGVLRSSSQMLATALLNRTAVQGLYLAGQNVMAPGIIGTIMGSFSTVKLILGAEEFKNLIRF